MGRTSTALNGIARDFAVFDHWFCEVPSQTFMNREPNMLSGHGDYHPAMGRSFRTRWTHSVPEWTMDLEEVGKGLSALGKTVGPGLIAKAREMGVKLPTELNDPGAELPPSRIVEFLRDVAGHSSRD
jgi:hypothetical protein